MISMRSVDFGVYLLRYFLEKANTPPGKEFWLGSDDLGRDLLTRICYGARISLFVGISATLIDLAIGIVWGGVAAFAGGRVDMAM